jgi:hypothetical protein
MKKLAAGMVSIWMVATAVPAQAAMTCSARHQVCLDFCAKTYKGTSNKCSTSCAEALPRCQQDGCWVVPMSNKCGYVKG